ncbi:YceI family protein [Puia dinghuensis]|uniref:Polyisoprenoid-binding protein n=1 Tax=Puia dinghuensis TaxID=1792502 RepID=A0A8J2XTV1_9BACT|nr:YceI family protein [Puia dinghuensis]GGB02494.1 polyisoprenoid-binding protein [Puia dinghuensis]
MLTQEVSTITKWNIDPMHSQIGFKVKHLMFTNVRGIFGEYEARISTDGTDFTTAEVDLFINPASINTNDSKRDEHLKSPDFFDVANFSEIKFTGKKVEKAGRGNDYILYGDLTIKGVTRPVELDVEFGGVAKDPWGNEKAGISIQGKINRKDWGLTYNAALETGGVVIGDEVAFDIEVELARQA